MNKTTLEYYYTTSGHMYTTARESLIISPDDLTLGRFPTLSKKYSAEFQVSDTIHQLFSLCKNNVQTNPKNIKICKN